MAESIITKICSVSDCGRKMHPDKPPTIENCPVHQAECVEPQAARSCICKTWSSLDFDVLRGNVEHHENCDGKGRHKTGLFKESEMSAEAFDYLPPESENFEYVAGMMIPKVSYKDAVAKAELNRELIEYLENHKDNGKRSFAELEQEFWRFRTGKLLESDLIQRNDLKPDSGAPDKVQNSIDPSKLIWHDRPDTSLSLLIIDMGDSCVVKVEKGEQFIFDTLPMPSIVAHQAHGPVVLNVPFAAVREAVDGERPVPRIERKTADGLALHYCNGREDNYRNIGQHEIDALCEIAGHPLPIYEGGTWEQLPDAEADGRTATCDFSFGFNAAKDQLPFKAYRYTR